MLWKGVPSYRGSLYYVIIKCGGCSMNSVIVSADRRASYIAVGSTSSLISIDSN